MKTKILSILASLTLALTLAATAQAQTFHLNGKSMSGPFMLGGGTITLSQVGGDIELRCTVVGNGQDEVSQLKLTGVYADECVELSYGHSFGGACPTSILTDEAPPVLKEGQAVSSGVRATWLLGLEERGGQRYLTATGATLWYVDPCQTLDEQIRVSEAPSNVEMLNGSKNGLHPSTVGGEWAAEGDLSNTSISIHANVFGSSLQLLTAE
jgi:hypothetical protein